MHLSKSCSPNRYGLGTIPKVELLSIHSGICITSHILKFFLSDCQVRGTPASGKTSLAQLVSRYIRQQEPPTNVIWIQGWSCDKVEAKGGWGQYFETEKGWDKAAETVFVFDEAQTSYDDANLWNNFFKSIHNYDNCRAIVFASYGSASARISIVGTPIYITDVQRVTLRALQHQDGLPPVGLFFTRMEFTDLVSKLYPSTKYRFDASFFNALFDLTEGHAGAIHGFMTIILCHEVGSFAVTQRMI